MAQDGVDVQKFFIWAEYGGLGDGGASVWGLDEVRLVHELGDDGVAH